MLVAYKGFALEAHRDASPSSLSRGRAKRFQRIYYSAIRVSDQWLLEDSNTEPEVYIREVIANLKFWVDYHLLHPEEPARGNVPVNMREKRKKRKMRA